MSKAITILLAIVIDLWLGDPPNRFHPVVAMGNWLNLGRHRAPEGGRFSFGAGWVLLGLSLFTGLAQLVNPFYFLGPIWLKLMFAYTNLRRAVAEVAQALSTNDLVRARRLLGWHLVSRDTTDLTQPEVIGATIESLAENLTDSLAAPLLAYAVGGLPAAVAYRFLNTADAMWGYQDVEFEQLGKFAAHLDDLLNWLPARLTGWLLVAAAWLAQADAPNAARTMLAQHRRTASPNAGWTMSAMAGACRVTLDKRQAYRLQGGPPPELAEGHLTSSALTRALRVADVAAILLVSASCFLSILIGFIKRK